jgi:hypothetical protein
MLEHNKPATLALITAAATLALITAAAIIGSFIASASRMNTCTAERIAAQKR